MLVLSLALGSGLVFLEEDSSLEQFETETEELETLEDIEHRFGSDGNETAAQIIVSGENVLTKDGLLRTLEVQQAFRDDDRINQTLVADEPFLDLASIVATTAAREEAAEDAGVDPDELEADAIALEEQVWDTVDLLNESLELYEERTRLDLKYQFGEIDEKTYEERRDRVDKSFDQVNESIEDNLSPEQLQDFEALRSDVFDIADELVEPGIRLELGQIDEEEFERKEAEVFEAIEAEYQRFETEVFADEIADLEDRLETAQEILDIELTLAEQIEQLESMNESEVEATLSVLLDGEQPRDLFNFLPRDYEIGEHQTDTRTFFVFQDTEEYQRIPGEEPEEVVEAQLAMAEIVDEHYGDDGYVFGPGILAAEIDQSLADSLWHVLPLALLFVGIVLTLAYRDLVDILLGLVGIVLVLLWTFGFMGWAGLTVNQVMVAVPMLLVGLSIDYSIHVFMRHREQRGLVFFDHDPAPRGAMTVVLTGLGIAFLWVTVTATIGFLANLVNPVPPIREFGLASAFGILSSFVIFGAGVPAAKIEIDEYLECRGIDRRRPALGTGGGRLSRVLGLGADAAQRAPLVVLLVITVLTVGGIAGAMAVDTSFEEEEFIADEQPAVLQNLPGPFAVGEYRTGQALEIVHDRFLRLDIPTHIVIDGDVTADDTLEIVAEAERSAATKETTVVTPTSEPFVTSPLTVMENVAAENLTVQQAMIEADTTGDGIPDSNIEALYDKLFAADPEAASEVIQREDGKYQSLRLLVYVHGDAETAAVLDDGEAIAAGVDDTGLNATSTGRLLAFDVVESDLLSAVWESLVVTLGVVFAVLALVYRWRHGSAILGGITLLPVALTLTWILGTMYLLDIPFNMMTGTIASLTIGLGVDYNIHLTERYLLERDRDQDRWAALRTTVTGTGGALFGSAVTTVGGFGMLIGAILPPLQQFGLITALTIAYAFIASVFVLPTFLAFWTRWQEGPVE